MTDQPKKPVWHVKPKMRSRSRLLRRDMTEAEQRVWYAIRAHRLLGTSFRRQTPIGPYIVDFVCHQRRLIVEIDGGQHFEDTRQQHDRRRDTYFRARGYCVLRFTNLDVMMNREGVLETIAAAIENAPSPTLPRKRGREHSSKLRSSRPPSPALPHKLGTKQDETARVRGSGPIAEQGS